MMIMFIASLPLIFAWLITTPNFWFIQSSPTIIVIFHNISIFIAHDPLVIAQMNADSCLIESVNSILFECEWLYDY